MRLLCACPVCNIDKKRVFPIHLNDDGVAIVTCDRGHRFAVLSPHDKYEILFDSAALSLLDEYPREAVMGFAGSMEQFFAFFVRVITRAELEINDLPEEHLDQAWKTVAAQSERQLGAFLFLHLLARGEPYRLDKQLVELRNQVVHKGYLPALEEATNYGHEIWNRINSLLWFLIENRQSGLLNESKSRHTSIRRSLPPELPVKEVPHGLMLSEREPNRGGFSERLFRLRTDWRLSVYGRRPG
jgi:hypothetical protein